MELAAWALSAEGKSCVVRVSFPDASASCLVGEARNPNVGARRYNHSALDPDDPAPRGSVGEISSDVGARSRWRGERSGNAVARSSNLVAQDAKEVVRAPVILRRASALELFAAFCRAKRQFAVRISLLGATAPIFLSSD